MSILYRGSSISAFYQISVHLAKRFQRRKFLEIDQSETRIACDSHVCWWIGMNWAIFIEDLSRMLPTKFQFIWPSGFRWEDFFRNQPIRNKNSLWRPCLLKNWNEMSNLYRGPAINRCFLSSFGSFGQAVSEERICLVMDRDKMSKL